MVKASEKEFLFGARKPHPFLSMRRFRFLRPRKLTFAFIHFIFYVIVSFRLLFSPYKWPVCFSLLFHIIEPFLRVDIFLYLSLWQHFVLKWSYLLILVWFGWVLWYINHCGLFKAKSFFYICIKYVWFVNSFWRCIFKWAWDHSFVHC